MQLLFTFLTFVVLMNGTLVSLAARNEEQEKELAISCRVKTNTYDF